MTFFPPWNSCERCERSSLRWGICAPTAKVPRVLVLAAAASRASQAVGRPDPAPRQIANAVREFFKLKAGDVHVDALLACGPAVDAEGHEVAACAQRLEDQATLENWPVDLVVLVGDHAARLARNAGLLTAAGFRLGGKNPPSVIVRDFWEIGEGPAWSILGPAATSPKRKPPAVAALLKELVKDRCDGHSWRPLGGEWRRVQKPPPGELIDSHVSGTGWLSPFLPKGAWPYCVLDVDLHNAIQHKHYDATVGKLTGLFPNGLFFGSSVGGGLHVYVRLPPDIGYADAAVWLAEFLLLRGLLLHKAAPGRFASVRAPVATRIVEAPLHPPRLPFGVGSELRGFPDPAKAVARFERWLKLTDCSDFERARAHVQRYGKKKRARWPERAAWARTYVSDLELQALGAPKPKKLLTTDPWTPYVSRLTPNVAALATHGCLAFGTRTTTMMRLADALAELVEPAAARQLLRYWVEQREHNSEDIHTAREEVLEFGDRLVDEAFANRGVPISVWSVAEVAIKKMYAAIGALTAPPLLLTEEECLRAAFYILRLFYMKRSGHIPIAAEQFGLALERDDVGGLPVRRPHKNRVDGVREALVRVGLVRQVVAPSYVHHRAGEFELNAPHWPPPPSGSLMRFQPP